VPGALKHSEDKWPGNLILGDNMSGAVNHLKKTHPEHTILGHNMSRALKHIVNTCPEHLHTWRRHVADFHAIISGVCPSH
jgi:hypothetical protein